MSSKFPDYGSSQRQHPRRPPGGAGGRVDDANQQSKKHPADFLLWKTDPSHLMR
jgi:cysteinyl-tRNA synthetase